MESDRQFSLHVPRALDCLGKGQDMVKFRIKQYEELGRLFCNQWFWPTECIIAGSKGEGLTAPYESDHDIMVLSNNVICSSNAAPFRNINGVMLFEAERRNTSPGYTILRLAKFDVLMYQQWIQQSLFKTSNGKLYFSSEFYMDFFKHIASARVDQRNVNICGPSHSKLEDGGYVSQDFVSAFLFICSDIIQSFILRPRDHEWPTNDQLTEISTLGGHVVPVCYKGSETAFLEWRICYTKTERLLVRILNDTQRKTYILLKMVSKTYISLVCKEITSYVLKNIVLWLSEYCDLDLFKEELLVDRLIQAVIFLRKCVINNNLPSYIIPERNLFLRKLDLTQRQKLIFLLTGLIDKGGCLLMGCERIHQTIIVLYKEPALAEQYRCKRDIIEKIWLLRGNRERGAVVGKYVE